MHISHPYAAFFDISSRGVVTILELMTIEEANKRYKRLGS